jgi:hypothetical protein
VRVSGLCGLAVGLMCAKIKNRKALACNNIRTYLILMISGGDFKCHEKSLSLDY